MKKRLLTALCVVMLLALAAGVTACAKTECVEGTYFGATYGTRGNNMTVIGATVRLRKSDKKVESVMIDEMYLPSSFAVKTNAAEADASKGKPAVSESDPVDFVRDGGEDIDYTAASATKKYARYIIIGDRYFKGEGRETTGSYQYPKYVQLTNGSGAGVEDLEEALLEGNDQSFKAWYYGELKAGNVYFAHEDEGGTEIGGVTLKKGDKVTYSGALVKSGTGSAYWRTAQSGTTLSWNENINKMQDHLKTSGFEFTESDVSDLQTTTGATLASFNDYMMAAKNAYDVAAGKLVE